LDADYYCPLYDLPYRLYRDPAGIPPFLPYMRVEPPDVDVWRKRLADGTERKRAGIVWSSGSPRCRYIPAADFKGIVARPEFAFFSLQKGSNAGEIANLPEVRDVGPDLTDFYETACVIEAMDLTITVDTAVAHLAGALGRPVWMITNYQPHWRWRGETQDCVWYPSMRIYRRPESLRWETVFEEIEADMLLAFHHGTYP
jgi:ADP-heptose:LPS heptosyltransferase